MKLWEEYHDKMVLAFEPSNGFLDKGTTGDCGSVNEQRQQRQCDQFDIDDNQKSGERLSIILLFCFVGHVDKCDYYLFFV